METIETRHADRAKLEAVPGPWADEPDRVQWPDAETGLPCLLTRNPYYGSLCGYVGVPEGHPLHGRDYGEEAVYEALFAHGGVNFSQPCQEQEGGVCHIPGPGEPDSVWWFGFDCAHGGDLLPLMDRKPSEILGDYLSPALSGSLAKILQRLDSGEYRDLAYVKAQCASLAQQLKALEG